MLFTLLLFFENLGSQYFTPNQASFVFTESSNTSCVIFNIVDDDEPEPTLNFTMTLIQGNNQVTFEENLTIIQLSDNDRK